jgi:prephenate dehydrogenase
MAFAFRRMVVAGVGLVGGSLAMAARKRKLVEEVFGYGRTEKNLRWAAAAGMIDRYFLSPDQMPPDVDLLVLATPVRTTESVVTSLLPRLERGCVVTDVGSTKEKIVRAMDRLLPREIPFVGAHPIAGGEKWGAEAADGRLFLGQRCIITPGSRTRRDALLRIKALWRGVGARVETMDARLHDRVFGTVSHLPHVVAYALVNAMAATKVDAVDLKRYCGGGFKDLTRIASSRPELWRDICLANPRPLVKGLGDYVKRLERIRRWIAAGRASELEKEFTRANEIRRRIV